MCKQLSAAVQFRIGTSGSNDCAQVTVCGNPAGDDTSGRNEYKAVFDEVCSKAAEIDDFIPSCS